MSAKTFEGAHERLEHGHEGPRWVPLAAAVLAVLAALSGFLGNRAATEALVEKNEQIIATTNSSDTWAQYQAGRIKYYISQTALDQGVNPGGKADRLAKRAAEEKAKGPQLKHDAEELHNEALAHDAESKRLIHKHETIEVGTTLFEIGIVLVSITALVGTRLPLTLSAGAAALLGAAFFLFGLTR